MFVWSVSVRGKEKKCTNSIQLSVDFLFFLFINKLSKARGHLHLRSFDLFVEIKEEQHLVLTVLRWGRAAAEA